MFYETLIAHRGFTKHAPENTIDALRNAIDAGFSWAEVDVQWSADGVPFLFHDRNFLRFAGPSDMACHLPWQRIATLSLCHAHSKLAFAPPVLESVLAFAAHTELSLNLELKYHSVPDNTTMRKHLASLQRLLHRFTIPRERLLLTSFSKRMTSAMRALTPWARLGRLISQRRDVQPASLTRLFDSKAYSTLNIPATLATAETIDWATRNKVEVLVYTVNAHAQAISLFQQGVSGIFTDTLTPK